MKKYIMFANNLSGIGGAELYILRKAKYLESRGFEVYIISAISEPLMINGIDELTSLSIPEMLFPTNVYSRKKIKNIINKIIDFISFKKQDTIYIESHQTSVALWAEEFANKTNSVNAVYPLAYFRMSRKVYKEFFNDKLDKQLLIGCSEEFMRINFNSNSKQYINIPFDKDEIEIKKNCVNIDSENDLNLLTISRIEKTYLIDTLKSIIHLAKMYPDLRIKYDIVVSSQQGKTFQILSSLSKEKSPENLIVEIKGPIVPLNNCLFENKDIFIGMGTSAINAMSFGVPALIIDYRDNKTHGFLGKNVFDFGMAKEKPVHDINYFLEQVLKDEDYRVRLSKDSLEYFYRSYESVSVNNEFIRLMENIKKDNKELTKIKKRFYEPLDLIEYILIFLFGAKKAHNFKRKIIDTFSIGSMKGN